MQVDSTVESHDTKNFARLRQRLALFVHVKSISLTKVNTMFAGFVFIFAFCYWTDSLIRSLVSFTLEIVLSRLAVFFRS